jgi:hypothetical protein
VRLERRQGRSITADTTTAKKGDDDDDDDDDVLKHSSAASAKAFVKLRSVATSVRPLTRFIEAKAGITTASSDDAKQHPHAAQYLELITECQRLYFSKRHALLYGELERYIDTLAKRTQLPSLVRGACAYLIEICTLEYQLFQDFFSVAPLSTQLVQELLGTLCKVLYTAVRPLVIHDVGVPLLCELVAIFKSEILEQQLVPRGDSVTQLQLVVHRLVQDVQERLIYVAQNVIRDQLHKYTTTAADVAYPAKLVEALVVKTTAAAAAATSEQKEAAVVPPPLHPVLRRTLLLLARLARSLDTRSYQFVARSAVAVCTVALISASKLVATRNKATSKASEEDQKRFAALHIAHGDADFAEAHGQLFLVQHLVLLKEHVGRHSIDLSTTSTLLDLSSLGKMVPGLLSSGGEYSKIMQVMRDTGPRVRETTNDLGKQLEEQLSACARTFAAQQTSRLIAPLERFHASVQPAKPQQLQGFPIIEKDIKRQLHDIVLLVTQLSDVKQTLCLSPRLQSLVSTTRLYIDRAIVQNLLLQPVLRVVKEKLAWLRAHTARLLAAAASASAAAAADVDASSAEHTALNSRIAALESTVLKHITGS